MPNIDFFREFKVPIDAIVLTHSHEDHLGAVSFLHGPMGSPPIYGTEFTLAMLRQRYEEYQDLDESIVHEVKAGQIFRVNQFEFEPLRVTHSLVDCIGLSIKTPIGTIVHTGDFKIDKTPMDDWEFDEKRYRTLGDEGVLLFMSDSTNAESSGWSLSESELQDSFLELIRSIESGKIFVTLFSSNIHRIQTLLNVAKKCNRKVAFAGRSVLSNTALAKRYGHLDYDDSDVISLSEVERYEPRSVMILCTGTQAEGRSALSKMTSGTHPDVEIRPGDTVIFSSRHIPGNEKRIQYLINNIYRCGARVIDYRAAKIHTSGHARAEELKEILSWVKPKFFVPVHGEYSMLWKHNEICRTHFKDTKSLIAENGDVLKLSANGLVKLDERVASGKVFLDENRNEVPEEIVRERKRVCLNGMVFVSAVFREKRFQLLQGPDFTTQGVPHTFDIIELEGQLADLFDDFRRSQNLEIDSLEEEVRVLTRRFFRKNLGLKPIVIPMIYMI